MPILEDYRDLIDSTLSNYISKRGGPMKLTYEILRNSYEFGELLGSDAKLKLQGGPTVKFHAILEENAMGGAVAPWQVRNVKQTNHLRQGEVKWSVYESSWAIEEIESTMNAGEFKLLDLVETNEEAMRGSAANELETWWWDSVGNMDKINDEKPRFRGIKAWITRDGKNIDGSATVAGIDTDAFKRYRSRYAGPLGSNLNKDLTHDANDKLTSANQLLDYMLKAWRYCKFASPNGMKFAMDERTSSAKKAQMRQQKIYCDEIAIDAWQKIQRALGHGRDNLSPAETTVAEPTFMGIPLVFIEDLGLDSNGIPAFAAHDNGGGHTLTAGAYANTGEMYWCNTKYMKVICQKDNAPLRKKLEFLPQQQVLWQLYRWIMSTVCQSRQRQCVLWGFGKILTQ